MLWYLESDLWQEACKGVRAKSDGGRPCRVESSEDQLSYHDPGDLRSAYPQVKTVIWDGG